MAWVLSYSDPLLQHRKIFMYTVSILIAVGRVIYTTRGWRLISQSSKPAGHSLGEDQVLSTKEDGISIICCRQNIKDEWEKCWNVPRCLMTLYGFKFWIFCPWHREKYLILFKPNQMRLLRYIEGRNLFTLCAGICSIMWGCVFRSYFNKC